MCALAFIKYLHLIFGSILEPQNVSNQCSLQKLHNNELGQLWIMWIILYFVSVLYIIIKWYIAFCMVSGWVCDAYW